VRDLCEMERGEDVALRKAVCVCAVRSAAAAPVRTPRGRIWVIDWLWIPCGHFHHSVWHFGLGNVC
jgi:hypothetical protein